MGKKGAIKFGGPRLGDGQTSWYEHAETSKDGNKECADCGNRGARAAGMQVVVRPGDVVLASCMRSAPDHYVDSQYAAWCDPPKPEK